MANKDKKAKRDARLAPVANSSKCVINGVVNDLTDQNFLPHSIKDNK